MLLRDFLQSSADPPDEYAPLIGRGIGPPLPPELNLCIDVLTSSLLDAQLGGLEFGKRGGVSEPEESPDEPKLKSGRGGVKVPLLPPFKPPFIGSMIQGLKKPCSNIAIERGSGRGMPIIP